MKQIEGFPKTIELLPEITKDMVVYRAKIVIKRTIEGKSKRYLLSISEFTDKSIIRCLLYKNTFGGDNLIGLVDSTETRDNIPDHHIILMLDTDKRTVTFLMPNNYELYIDDYVIENFESEGGNNYESNKD